MSEDETQHGAISFLRRSAGCLPISASSIYSKHTEVEVEVEVDIAPRSACSEAVIEFDKH